MFGSRCELSDAELDAIISHTRIPTIVIEGKEDLFLFRRIEEDIGSANISLLPAGGRSRVLYAFNNRPDTSIAKILFFTDKDEWEFNAIPGEYDCAEFSTTDGYSIENDLLRDGSPLAYMSPDEKAAFEIELDRFLVWFAIQMQRFLAGGDAELTKFPSRILDDEEQFRSDTELRDDEEEPAAILNRLREDPFRSARGKSLLQIISRQLNVPGRPARHQPRALLEAGASARGPHFQKVLEWVKGELGI